MPDKTPSDAVNAASLGVLFFNLFNLYHFCKLGENFQTALQNTVDMRNGYSVVAEGHSVPYRRFPTARHFLFVEHTAAAMHGESRPRQTFGKAVSRRKAEIQLSARKLLYPFGQLDGSYILALSTVSPSLSSESAAAPFTASESIPLTYAKRMENDVSLWDSGSIFLTAPKA